MAVRQPGGDVLAQSLGRLHAIQDQRVLIFAGWLERGQLAQDQARGHVMLLARRQSSIEFGPSDLGQHEEGRCAYLARQPLAVRPFQCRAGATAAPSRPTASASAAPRRSSHGQRSPSSSGIPARMCATLSGAWKRSPSRKRKPSRRASNAPSVDLPLPLTPMITIAPAAVESASNPRCTDLPSAYPPHGDAATARQARSKLHPGPWSRMATVPPSFKRPCTQGAPQRSRTWVELQYRPGNGCLSASAVAFAVSFAQPALAQTASAPPVSVDPAAPPSSTGAPAPTASGEIVVTGSRITASGFTAPTPTQVIDAKLIARSAEPNLFTTVAQLPSLLGSTGTSTYTGSTSSGLQGLSSFSLRGLGPIRTLTLLDGQRFVGANVTGVPDVSQFPQLLIERVDVVTGGASASYGSDAVGGVINFITDKHFKGLRTNIEGGLTTYGDDSNITAQAAYGTSFAKDSIHLEVSGEYSREDGVPAYGFGTGPGPNGRTWFQSPALTVRPIALTPAGQPQILNLLNAQQFQYAKYGLITSGPLQGIAFGANGQPFQFHLRIEWAA